MSTLLSIDELHAAVTRDELLTSADFVKLFRSIPLDHADGRYLLFRGNLLQHPSFPLAELESLPRGDKQATRALARRNWDATAETLTQLSFCADVLTRGYVAGTPRTPLAVLKRLVGDESQLVRASVGSRKDAKRRGFPQVLG